VNQYVPESQRDSAWYIWNSLFMCRIPYIHTRSLEHIQMYGIPTCGDPLADREAVKEKVTTMLTIAQMIEYFERGVTIGVVKYDDTKKIYERITDHLNAWKSELHNCLNVKDAPLEDLIVMDKFANAVYQHAKYQFTPEIVDSILAREMEAAMPVNRGNVLQGGPPGIGVTRIRAIKDEPTGPIDRSSMADIFASRRESTKPKWS
jgi:hypothetical protein